MKRFIDDIANEVIEAKLISPLGEMFTPVAVSEMSADLVASMAGESEEHCAQREQLTKQLNVLTEGSKTCKRFIGFRLLGKLDPCLIQSTACSNPGQVPMTMQLNRIPWSLTVGSVKARSPTMEAMSE